MDKKQKTDPFLEEIATTRRELAEHIRRMTNDGAVLVDTAIDIASKATTNKRDRKAALRLLRDLAASDISHAARVRAAAALKSHGGDDAESK